MREMGAEKESDVVESRKTEEAAGMEETKSKRTDGEREGEGEK